jgi:hypothetical protein
MADSWLVSSVTANGTDITNGGTIDKDAAISITAAAAADDSGDDADNSDGDTDPSGANPQSAWRARRP